MGVLAGLFLVFGGCLSQKDEDYKNRFKIIAKLALPAVLGQWVMICQEILNMVFVGHLKDATKIAAVGIGNASINIFGLAVIMGMNAALNTFVAQGFGAGNISLCIVYLKRSRVAMTICFIPITIILMFTETLLVAIG